MNRRKIVVSILVGVLALGLGAILFWPHDGPSETAKQLEAVPEDLVQSSIIKEQDEYNQTVRSEVLKGNIQNVDSMGIRNSLPSDWNESTSLIEFRSFERKLDGSIHPFYLVSLGLQSQVPPGETLSGGGYGVGGYGLRLGLSDKLDGMSYLLWNTEYTAIGIYHRPDDPNNITRGKTSEVRFITPAKLAPGEIYRVDLILVDRIKEKEAAEQIAIAKERRERLQEEEKITLKFSSFREETEKGLWQATYNDGTDARGFGQSADGTFVLKGPNKLGGELVVYYHMDFDFFPWLYVANVKKRTLNLPEDATSVIDEDTPKVKFSLAVSDKNLFDKPVRVDFLASENSKLPLSWIIIKPEQLKELEANNWQIEGKIPPRQYYIKITVRGGSEYDLGVLNISDNPEQVYTLKIAPPGT